MKKPTEAIERMRKSAKTEWPITFDGIEDILAYLDSIPDDAVPVVWPKGLTRERLEELALIHTLIASRSNALRAFAAIAPKREKRKVNIWCAPDAEYVVRPQSFLAPNSNWRKVNAEPVEVEE